MIAPGRVFRADEVDATHSPSFHQIEGMVIDKNITFSDLKGTLTQFVQQLFGKDTKVKFRPHHFPFTEPSATTINLSLTGLSSCHQVNNFNCFLLNGENPKAGTFGFLANKYHLLVASLKSSSKSSSLDQLSSILLCNASNSELLPLSF